LTFDRLILLRKQLFRFWGSRNLPKCWKRENGHGDVGSDCKGASDRQVEFW